MGVTGARFDASTLSVDPTLLVATTRKRVMRQHRTCPCKSLNHDGGEKRAGGPRQDAAAASGG
jgi:hypothetical protein